MSGREIAAEQGKPEAVEPGEYSPPRHMWARLPDGFPVRVAPGVREPLASCARCRGKHVPSLVCVSVGTSLVPSAASDVDKATGEIVRRLRERVEECDHGGNGGPERCRVCTDDLAVLRAMERVVYTSVPAAPAEVREVRPADHYARQAFEAYGAAVGGLNVQGKPIPTWFELPEHIRAAWRAAAVRVAQLVGGEE